MSQDSESHTVTILYDRPLVRHALNCFMLKRIGKIFFVVLGLVILGLGYAYFINSWSRTSTCILLVLVVAVCILIFSYFARLRASEGFFQKADDPSAQISFTDDGVETESDLGMSNLKWSVFEELLKFPKVWLLVYAKSAYLTLPVDQLTSECMTFIDEKLIANETAEE